MKRFIFAVVATLVLMVGIIRLETACTINGQTSPIVAPAGQLVSCIVSTSMSDPVEIVTDQWALIQMIISDCAQYGIATVAGIIAALEDFLAGTPSQDAATATVGGTSVQATVRARVNKVLSAAFTVQFSDAGSKH